ncbi:Crp/Fnr family transcriptional regulator [Methylotuvimicrobium sp. KM1]|uniref:Crp/Fnr family transcriptional regulator n=1 Tax=Methylotuvimicrobium sp. KM1 TaxID=3377707 RepID=UPI00385164D7
MYDEHKAFIALKQSLVSYSPISDETWQAFQGMTAFRLLQKKTMLYRAGEIPRSYAYVYKGLIRCFVCDENGNEYNKIFFAEGTFPGAMTALLTSSPSLLTFEALEESLIIEIDFACYRQLLLENEDLKLFQIRYLEKNWLLAKDAREIEIVQEDATTRYLRFIEEYPNLVDRLPQYHVASHLGVTPTQLSRIRKKL